MNWPVSESESRKVSFGCCFCGYPGADRGITLIGLDGQWEQQWWCHLNCLLGKMVEQARSAYVPVDDRLDE